MSYENTTPHEIRISRNLSKVARKLDKLLTQLTGAPCYFILPVNSRQSRDASSGQALNQSAVGSYVSNVDRETATIIMLEMIAKWQSNGDIGPVHLLKDGQGRTLEQILGDSGVH